MKTTVKKGTVKLMPSVFALKKCYVNSRGVLKQFESKGPMRDCLELQSRPVLVKNETSIGVMGGMGSFEDETKHIYGNPQQGDTRFFSSIVPATKKQKTSSLPWHQR